MNGPASLDWARSLLLVLGQFLVTSSLSIGLVSMGTIALNRVNAYHPLSKQIVMYDAFRYSRISEEGYQYDPLSQSPVVFFPGFPLLMRGMQLLFGISARLAGLILSNSLLVLSAWLLCRLVQDRESPKEQGWSDLSVAWLMCFPIGVFFRVGYSESLFLLVAIGAVYAEARRMPWWFVALLAGLASGIRPTGIALVPLALIAAWGDQGHWGKRLLKTGAAGLISVWGLIAYASYLGFTFGAPFAFALNQEIWVKRTSIGWEKWWSLIRMEPFWGAFVPGTPSYWINRLQGVPWYYQLPLLDALIPLLSLTLIGIGTRKGWLRRTETIYGILVTLIPYVTIAWENYMQSQARFSLVAFPVYIVLARMTMQLPNSLRGILLLIMFAGLAVISYGYGRGGTVF